MKIANFKRDAENKIIAIDADGKETALDFAYVAANKPKIGDDYWLDTVIEEPKAAEEPEVIAEPAAVAMEESAAASVIEESAPLVIEEPAAPAV
jgi:hypothetical protein